MRPSPLSGVRADHDRLRQVLHVLHRAHGARARAEPPARRDRGRSPPAGRRRLPRDHAAGPDGQQLPATRRWADAPAACRTCSRGCTRSTGSSAQVRHQLSQGHDRRPARRPSAICQSARPICTCRRKADRTGCCERMKRGYTVEDYREMLARIRDDDSRCRGDERLHRRLLRRDGRGFPADGRAGARVAIQEQLHLQIQRAARHQGRPSCSPTTCPKRSSGGETTSCWRSRTRSAKKTTRPLLGRQVEVLVEGPEQNEPQHGGGTDCAVDRAGRIVTGSSCSTGTERQIGQFLPVDDLRRQRLHAVRQRRNQSHRARSVQLVGCACVDIPAPLGARELASHGDRPTASLPRRRGRGGALAEIAGGWRTRGGARQPGQHGHGRRDARSVGRDVRSVGRALARSPAIRTWR